MAGNNGSVPGLGNGSVLRKKRAFLAAFEELGTITHAARAAKIQRILHYNWLKDDPEYVKDFEAAQEHAADALEKEARRRATVGVKEAVYYKGTVVGHIRKYSDVLLIFMLKGRRPDVFSDKVQVEAVLKNRLKKLAARYGVSEDQVMQEAEAILRGE